MTPALMILAERDPVVRPEMAAGIENYVPNVVVKRINCGHWTQQEAPEETTRAMLDFLADVK